MKTAPYFQSDDIPECEPKKDCIKTYYRIKKGGVIIKEGLHAKKQTKNVPDIEIFKRRWNESKREWIDANYEPETNNK